MSENEKITPQTRLDNAVVKRIVAAVWPGSVAASALVLSRLYGDVRDVIEDLSVPTVSRADREKILVEWEKEKRHV